MSSPATSYDPFDTKDCRELRAAQRRTISLIDRGVLIRVAIGQGKNLITRDQVLPVMGFEANAVEWSLRRLAQSLEVQAASYFDAYRADGLARAQRNALSRVTFDLPEGVFVNWSPPAADDDLPQLFTSEAKDFHRGLAIMVLADVVAGDYMDPRIVAATQSSNQ